jgi:hypothetical protein
LENEEEIRKKWAGRGKNREREREKEGVREINFGEKV